MPTGCDGCGRALLPGGEVYYEVAIRVRPAGGGAELDASVTGSGQTHGPTPDEGAACAERLEALALEEMLAESLRPRRYTLCGGCRRTYLGDPLAAVSARPAGAASRPAAARARR